MHIELTEMLRCPRPHAEAFLVLSTGEMQARMVRTAILGCPACQGEYPIVKGIVHFEAASAAPAPSATPHPAPRTDSAVLQAALDLSGPGGYVVLLGAAARHAAGLAELMAGVHFVAVNAPEDVAESQALSLLRATDVIPLRQSMARGV